MRRFVGPSPKLISLFILFGLAFCPCVFAQFNPVQAAQGAYNKTIQEQSQQQPQQQQKNAQQQKAPTL
jgi:hypothetical protein